MASRPTCRTLALGAAGLVLAGFIVGCDDGATSRGSGSGPSLVDLDTTGGGPIVPAPGPNLDYDPPGYVPGADYYDTPSCVADITTC